VQLTYLPNKTHTCIMPIFFSNNAIQNR
jgi:hypothetical protein